MRRTLAAAILGISLWIGSLAWTGFLLTNTVLDPGRSEDVAEALYDDEQVRDQLAANLAAAIDASLPAGVTVERGVLETAAHQALESPAVEAAITDALVRTHQGFLGEGDVPDAVDAGSFGAAARDAVVDARPDLDDDLPTSPQLRLPLPTERIPNLGPVREAIEAGVPLLAAVSAAGALLALGVTKNRPAILRRAGFWSIGLSATVLAFAYGIPWLAERFTPDQSEIVAALVGAMVDQTRGPALVAAGAGAAAVVASFIWKATPAVLGSMGEGAAAEHIGAGAPPGAPTTRWYQRRDIGVPERSGGAGVRSTGRTAGAPTWRPDPDGYARRPAVPAADPHPGYPTRPPPPSDPTKVQAAPRTPTPDASRQRVVDASEAIPDDARWVPGVGYVVDDA